MVPTSAVRVDQAKPYVLVVANDKVVQRSVTLGARGLAKFDDKLQAAVQVVDGVSDNTVVLRGTAGNVRDGTPVRVVGIAAPAPATSRASAV